MYAAGRFSRFHHADRDGLLTAMEDSSGVSARSSAEEAMFQPNPANWPIRYADSGQPQQQCGGVAPLRHDIALARYLEKQAAHRASASLGIDLWSAAIGLCVQVAESGLAMLRTLRSTVSRRPRDVTG